MADRAGGKGSWPPEGVPTISFSLKNRTWATQRRANTKSSLRTRIPLPSRSGFRRIPPPQLDEVRDHLKLMLDAGVIRPSNSPWCNAVVLVRKKDGSLRFCIDFRRLNSLTVKDSYPLPAHLRDAGKPCRSWPLLYVRHELWVLAGPHV